MKDIRRIVAANIAALRKNAGYTQAALAEKLQYSDKAVSKWESGASMPDAGVLMSIADVYKRQTPESQGQTAEQRRFAPAAFAPALSAEKQ